jgi:CDC6, C terminal winged helix domain
MRKNAEKLAAEAAKRAAKVAWYRRLWDLVSEVDQVGHGNVEQAVREACDELKIKRANFFRYLKKYRTDPRLKALSPRLSNLIGHRSSRSPKRSLDLLQEVIDQHYLTRDQMPVSKVYETYEVICWREGVHAVSSSTMWRHIRAIPESVVARRRAPKHLRGKKYRLNYAVPEIAFAPLEVV